jgi:hypothetical protein
MFVSTSLSLALFFVLLIVGAGCGRNPPQRTAVGTYMAERRDRVQDLVRLEPSGTFTQEIVAPTGEKFGGAGRWRLVDQKVRLDGLLELRDAMVITQSKAFVKVDAVGFDALAEDGENDAGRTVFRRIER